MIFISNQGVEFRMLTSVDFLQQEKEIFTLGSQGEIKLMNVLHACTYTSISYR